MAAVRTSTERNLNRLAIVAVLLVTLIFLAPIYWIASTAFKPRNLATTVLLGRGAEQLEAQPSFLGERCECDCCAHADGRDDIVPATVTDDG